jgi:hypothetical protein
MIIKKINSYIKHLPGWRTNKKILVIESDDWGSIRMPSNQIREKLINLKIDLGKNNFLKYDTLADKEDLTLLFDVLSSVKDFQGNNAKFTPFVNLTNPDFEKIKSSGYNKYFFETFIRTQEKYYGVNFLSDWMNGIEKKIFFPEYHGREHFNVPLLMKFLKTSKDLRTAFDHGVIHIAIPEIKPEKLLSIAPAYYIENEKKIGTYINSLVDGVAIFKNIFKQEPSCFAAPNGIFHPILENELAKTGVKNFVVNRQRVEPDLYGNLKKRSFNFSYGKINNNGHLYYRRNVKFEPVQSSYSFQNVINEVDAAFTMGKPAVISTHKINFVGGLNKEHRNRSLNEFKKLLESVINKHPDLIFMSSKELCNLIRKKNEV